MSALSDPIADFLTRIRNSNRALQAETTAPFSKMKAEIARILKEEGYIENYEVDTSGTFPEIKIVNKLRDRTSAIRNLKRISKPGLRRYVSSDKLPRVLGGLGISILSTSKGVVSGREARRQKLGGELLAFVW